MTNISSNAPIGLFDSGVGGLSIYRNLATILPYEQYVYFADTANVPYGGREKSDIVFLTLNAVDWLYNQGCKLIVIACNSASAHGLKQARERYPEVPIVGLVPALKPAVFHSKTKKVAVLATQATLDGRLLNTVIDDFARPHHVEIIKHFEASLVPWIEMGMPKAHATALKLTEIISYFHNLNVDTVVLGCTHYPFFRKFVEALVLEKKWQMVFIDSGEAIAKRVHQILSQNQMLHPDSTSELITQSAIVNNPLHFYSSGVDDTLEDLISSLIDENAEYMVKVI